MSAAQSIPVYLEIGSKRVFAGALEWPGWSRSGRGDEDALDALAAYGPRYAAALKGSGIAFGDPPDRAAYEIVERLAGGSSTDFGAPSATPRHDRAALDEEEAARHVALLQAAWETFDRVAGSAVRVPLAKGPRGGGRELDLIVRHVLDAELAYLAALGGRYRATRGGPIEEVMAGTRAAVIETLMSRVRGQPLPPTKRTSPLWTPRFFVRRSAWHALDHAWEIEDRVQRGS